MIKVVAVNGSPLIYGNTYQAIQIVLRELEREGIETEILQVGDKLIRGCIGCNLCRENKDEKCIIKGDMVNESIQKMKNAQGLLFASPVYFCGIAGTMKCFLDRAMYVSRNNGNMMKFKVGGSLATARRAGGVCTVDGLNYYFSDGEVTMPSSNYWNVIYTDNENDEFIDKEGIATLRKLGRNMAKLLKEIYC